jgi:hypothetical protein
VTVDEKIRKLVYALGLALGALEGLQYLMLNDQQQKQLLVLMEKLHAISEDCL